MKMNFKGLVKLHTLSINMPLLPLYEAVVNSIQSIEDAKTKDGIIEIIIEREKQMSFLDDWETDIENIIIKDNGIGFTKDNYNSFDTYASEFKILKGCKGIGRILWLKAYYSVNINSIYRENDELMIRTFNFDPKNAVHGMTNEKLNESVDPQTIIKLCGLREPYKKTCPKKIETIARDILNHCFAYYVLGKAPKIVIKDNHDTIDLDSLYRENMDGNIEVINTKIQDMDLTIIHSRNYMTSVNKQEVNLCAHQRVVQPINLIKLFDNISAKLENDKGEFIYTGYVLSDLLDDNVNRERTKFELPEQQNLVNKVGIDEIIEKVKSEVSSFLANDIEKSNQKKRDFISDYICTKNPKYRILLKNCPDMLDNIPWVNDEDKLEMELFKYEQSYRLELKKEGKKLQEEARRNIVDYESYIEKCTKYAEKISDMGKSNLADYVMHRKAILDILSQNLKYKDEERKKYAYEKNIHQLIFPMKKTSDDIDYMNHNLWIIDEKLAYHHYLASDKKLKSISEIESDSAKEPDIIIFDAPFAFTDEEIQPYRNITIIEFKRPGREQYTDNENPIKQVKEYMDDIIEGKIKSKDGEFLSDTENIRFFCYVLCDIDATMHKYAKMEDLKRTPDNMGYYKYIDSYKAYMEIIPYNKLIQDSQKRNKILFDRLFNQT